MQKRIAPFDFDFMINSTNSGSQSEIKEGFQNPDQSYSR